MTHPPGARDRFEAIYNAHYPAIHRHAGFEAKGEIRQSDFGLGFGLPVLGDSIKIQLDMQSIEPESHLQADPGTGASTSEIRVGGTAARDELPVPDGFIHESGDTGHAGARPPRGHVGGRNLSMA